jgi:hypothetical protein
MRYDLRFFISHKTAFFIVITVTSNFTTYVVMIGVAGDSSGREHQGEEWRAAVNTIANCLLKTLQKSRIIKKGSAS